MCKPSMYIFDICYECHPQSYDKTLAKFAGQERIVDVIGAPDDSWVEYLYECCGCRERVWVDEQWVRDNAVAETFVNAQHQTKSLKQRSDYIRQKGAQLYKITDADKYIRRLSRIMAYHRLLTDFEVAEIRNGLNRVFPKEE